MHHDNTETNHIVLSPCFMSFQNHSINILEMTERADKMIKFGSLFTNITVNSEEVKGQVTVVWSFWQFSLQEFTLNINSCFNFTHLLFYTYVILIVLT